MKISSTYWVILIAFGALAVAIGNIQYNIAKERERSESTSKKALEILKNELVFNLEKVKSMKVGLAKNEIDLVGLRNNSWGVISNAGLLTQLDTETLGQITEIYNCISIVNSYNERVLNLNYGVNAAMPSSGPFKIQLIKYTLDQLNALEPAISQILNSEHYTTN